MKTTRLSALFLSLITITLLMSCKSQPHGAILQREWTANAEFAGDLWAARLSEKHGLKLEVHEGSEVIDPVKMVRSGSAQFGVASSDRVLREIDGGADLVVLATASYRSPVVFLSHPDLRIKAPADFKGRRIGIQAGTNTDLIFRALIRTVPLSINDMKVIESGFGTTNFETGTLDVLAGFDYDEPVQLEIKKTPFDVIEPEKFGVHFIGTVYFTSKSLVEKNPKLVQAFLDSLIEGWTNALAHPDEAIDLLASRFPSVDKKKEGLSLQRGRPYFAGENGRLLYASPSRWAQMGDELVSMGVLKKFVFDNSVDYRFLNIALKGMQR